MAEKHPHALPAGFRLEEYEIVRVLGAGGFGITYLATDRQLDGPVALKEYFPHGHAGRAGDRRVAALSTESQELFAWGLDRFLDEARSIHRFRHPNVVRVHRYLEAHGTAYIVMEYIEGESLEAVLEARAPLPAAEWRRWLNRLLDGLAHVHGHGYLHRDIKPANIVLRTTDGEPVFIDFGAARTAARERTHTQVMTPPYAPIEQHGSEGVQGPPTDIYALAAVSYRALTGTLPPNAPDRAVHDHYEPLVGRVPGADLPWLSAIDQGLALRAENRPPTVAAWRAALNGVDDAPDNTSGISVTNLSGETRAICESMARRTFVGIDFGTSTTVVSIACMDEGNEVPIAEPLQIPQFDEDGRRIDDHLVPSCLAWRNDRLLVGRGVSPHLKSLLLEGRDVWSSFKMLLGVDLGPQYPNTVLAKGRAQVVIERPQDAATVFFEYIRQGCRNAYCQQRPAPTGVRRQRPRRFRSEPAPRPHAGARRSGHSRGGRPASSMNRTPHFSATCSKWNAAPAVHPCRRISNRRPAGCWSLTSGPVPATLPCSRSASRTAVLRRGIWPSRSSWRSEATTSTVPLQSRYCCPSFAVALRQTTRFR